MNARSILVWKTDSRGNNPTNSSVDYNIVLDHPSDNCVEMITYEELCVMYKLIGEFIEEGKGGQK